MGKDGVNAVIDNSNQYKVIALVKCNNCGELIEEFEFDSDTYAEITDIKEYIRSTMMADRMFYCHACRAKLITANGYIADKNEDPECRQCEYKANEDSVCWDTLICGHAYCRLKDKDNSNTLAE